jgi:hypothetical protein
MLRKIYHTDAARYSTADAAEHRHLCSRHNGVGNCGLGRERINSNDRISIDISDDRHVSRKHEGFDKFSKDSYSTGFAHCGWYFNHMTAQIAHKHGNMQIAHNAPSFVLKQLVPIILFY